MIYINVTVFLFKIKLECLILDVHFNIIYLYLSYDNVGMEYDNVEEISKPTEAKSYPAPAYSNSPTDYDSDVIDVPL